MGNVDELNIECVGKLSANYLFFFFFCSGNVDGFDTKSIGNVDILVLKPIAEVM